MWPLYVYVHAADFYTNHHEGARHFGKKKEKKKPLAQGRCSWLGASRIRKFVRKKLLRVEGGKKYI